MRRDERRDGRRKDHLSPTEIAKASACLHYFHLERFGDKSRKLPATAGQQLDWERGREFEASVARSLDGVEEPVWDGRDFRKGLDATVGLMKKGAAWIHGGPLLGRGIAGVADLLRKEPGQSRFGDYTYSPVEIKGHKTVQKKDILQVSAYAHILDDVLGAPCPRAGVWLNTGKIEEVDLGKGSTQLQAVMDRMDGIRRRTTTTEPVWCGACKTCPWLAHCKGEWNRLNHISLLPGGGKGAVEKLYSAGVRSVPELAAAEPGALARKAKMTPAATLRLWQYAKARVEGRPIPIKKAKFPSGKPIVFYDIETYGGHTFLHGLIRVNGREREEQFFFADTLEEAGAAWKRFLEYVARDKDSVIYCWTEFERGGAEKCWKDFGGDLKAYDAFMKRLTDQCAWTREHFAFPTRSYSIKEIAPVFGFHWQASDAGGLNCEAWYGEWLQSRDPKLKAKILEYNRDDVVAMEVIFNALSERFGSRS